MSNPLTIEESLACLEPRELASVKIGLSLVARHWKDNPVCDREDLVQSGVLAIMAVRQSGRAFESDREYIYRVSSIVRKYMNRAARTSLPVSIPRDKKIPPGIGNAVPIDSSPTLAAPPEHEDDAGDTWQKLFIEYASEYLTNAQRLAISKKFGVLGSFVDYESMSREGIRTRHNANVAIGKLRSYFVDGKPMISMMPGSAIDRTGKRYGHLLAIEPASKRGPRGVSWLCQCDCGNRVTRASGELPGSVSCGPKCPYRNESNKKNKKEVSNKSA